MQLLIPVTRAQFISKTDFRNSFSLAESKQTMYGNPMRVRSYVLLRGEKRLPPPGVR